MTARSATRRENKSDDLCLFLFVMGKSIELPPAIAEPACDMFYGQASRDPQLRTFCWGGSGLVGGGNPG